ncbi:hypothetical protein [Breoghania sp.]|uniref:hypothetical protein n=1 Tax=Breoghania sp. TaxID=2065378 RepID=UPI002AA7C774|nr:hypothetical protein [Breoghania sp.]
MVGLQILSLLGMIAGACGLLVVGLSRLVPLRHGDGGRVQLFSVTALAAGFACWHIFAVMADGSIGFRSAEDQSAALEAGVRNSDDWYALVEARKAEALEAKEARCRENEDCQADKLQAVAEVVCDPMMECGGEGGPQFKLSWIE